jgi:fructosamine-3-kinase
VIPAPAVEAALGRRVAASRRVSGGDLNDAWRIDFEDGGAVFAKTSPDARPGGYAAEAAGLERLGAAAALPVPGVLAVSGEFLVLEWIDEGSLSNRGAEALGRGLAAVHAAGEPAFGGTGPLLLGPLEIPNEPLPSWPEFYAERRLRPLARMAADRGALPDGALDLVERVCERLPGLAGPAEPPARLHGDLWGGNVLADAEGMPWLIDPAAYGGHREIDLAMLRLFGGPGERCFDAYAEAAPLADGHAERVELWQLFPLLVHAALFGGGYGGSAARAARRYL